MTNYKLIRAMQVVCIALIAAMSAMGLYICSIVEAGDISADYIRDIVVDTMGIMVGGILVLGLVTEKEKDVQNRSMFRLIFVAIILFFTDLMSSFMEGDSDYIFAIAMINTLAFVGEDILGYCYWLYIREELRLRDVYARIADKMCFFVLAISVIVDILNFKFGYFFTISSEGEYVDAPLEYVGDLGIFVIFIIVAIAIVRKKESSVGEKLILLTFGSFPFVAYLVGIIAKQYVLLLPAYMLSIMLIYIRIFSQRGKKLAEQKVILSKQSTALMISQIQPHFLYNVLTTISNLCATDPEEAEETTVLFSQYLRTNLDSLRNEEPVMFSVELGHIKTYVELEKKRFGDILNVEYDIQETNFKVPSLGLQPIVENSIKHGIRGKNAPGHIKLGAYKAKEGYKIIIEDDGIGFDMNMPAKDDGRSHVGMHNVKERLRQMCNATMDIQSSPGNGCRTEIFIPE